MLSRDSSQCRRERIYRIVHLPEEEEDVAAEIRFDEGDIVVVEDSAELFQNCGVAVREVFAVDGLGCGDFRCIFATGHPDCNPAVAVELQSKCRYFERAQRNLFGCPDSLAERVPDIIECT